MLFLIFQNCSAARAKPEADAPFRLVAQARKGRGFKAPPAPGGGGGAGAFASAADAEDPPDTTPFAGDAANLPGEPFTG